MITQVERRGIVTLTEDAASSAARGRLWNDDLRPSTAAEHTWSDRRYSGLWVGMSLCIPAYALGGSMISAGLNWYEALLSIFAGSACVLVPIALTAHAGTRYGLAYPVFARLWFGVRGAHAPALARALAGVAWFAVSAWLGGGVIDTIVGHFAPLWKEFAPHTAIAFALFLLTNVAVASRGPQTIARIAGISALAMTVAAIAALLWGAHVMGTVPRMLATPASVHGGAFWSAFFASAMSAVAFWATLAMNVPDFSRYAVSQRASLRGAFAMPFVMGIFAFVGIAVTSASVFVSGHPLANPVDLLVTFSAPVVIAGGLALLVSSTVINVAANAVAPARAFENLLPRRLTFARGAVVAGIASLLLQPWAYFPNDQGYVYTWLGTLTTMIGPFEGIAIADYWLVRRKRIDLAALYASSGRYAYANGWNARAIAALIAGWFPMLVGLFVEPLAFLWTGGWLFSIAFGGAAYALMMRADPSRLSADEYAAMTRID